MWQEYMVLFWLCGVQALIRGVRPPNANSNLHTAKMYMNEIIVFSDVSLNIYILTVLSLGYVSLKLSYYAV